MMWFLIVLGVVAVLTLPYVMMLACLWHRQDWGRG